MVFAGHRKVPLLQTNHPLSSCLGLLCTHPKLTHKCCREQPYSYTPEFASNNNLPHMRLSSFPTELLAEICSHLCWHYRHGRGGYGHGHAHAHGDTIRTERQLGDGVADRINFSRTCRTLRAVAQPFAFHRLCTDNMSGFYCFVLTLLDYPDLAKHVREVELHHVRGFSERDVLLSLDCPEWLQGGLQRGWTTRGLGLATKRSATPNLSCCSSH